VILAIVVNWNGWQDTMRCVESLCAAQGPQFEILVCDNGSADGSFEKLSAWVGGIGSIHPPNERSKAMTTVHGPFAGGAALQSIRVMRLDANYGYAGGANRAIEWGMQDPQTTAFWILNNDVRVKPDTLEQLAAAADRRPGAGLFGSVLLEWDSDRIQAVAGIFRKWLAVGYHSKSLPEDARVESGVLGHIDYPVGASLFATREFIEKVGMMDDGYFLYYEEMDWAERARQHGFRPAIALRSQLHHREGASTGSTGVRGKSLLSEHYGVLSRLRITRKFWPARLPIVWMSLGLVVLDRLVHGEWRRAALVARLALFPWAARAPA
jgi:GT2 family glycosyltransferase